MSMKQSGDDVECGLAVESFPLVITKESELTRDAVVEVVDSGSCRGCCSGSCNICCAKLNSCCGTFWKTVGKVCCGVVLCFLCEDPFPKPGRIRPSVKRPLPTPIPFSEAAQIRERFERLPARLGFEPTFVLFNGRPGTYKSLGVAKMVETLGRYGYCAGAKVMVDAFSDDLLRANADVIAQGKYGLHVLFLDELFMNPSDCNDDGTFIITGCSSAPNSPKAADMKLKGKRLRPAIWFGTSNNYDVAEFKVSKDAIARRITIRVDVPAKGEYYVDGELKTTDEILQLVLGDLKRRVQFVEDYFDVDEEIAEAEVRGLEVKETGGGGIKEFVADYSNLRRVPFERLCRGGKLRTDLPQFLCNVTTLDAMKLDEIEKAGYACLKYNTTSAFVSNWTGFLKEDLPTDGSVVFAV